MFAILLAMSLPLVLDLMRIFDGFSDAYGVYELTGEVDERGKALGKAKSIKGPVPVELWEDHVAGTRGIGIIPIKADSTVMFGAIDIDEYPLDLTSLAKNIHDNEIPLIVCRTKSGGAHLYLFCRQPVAAKVMITKLREFSAFLGYGSAEIFPKQTKIIAERGDIGQWINMPYFNAYTSLRYAINERGQPLTPEDFVLRVNRLAMSPMEVENLSLKIPEKLEGGPPCLQKILLRGFPQGTRNIGLFNLGVYARKVSPDNWQGLIEELNGKYMDPPLVAGEVLGVIKSLNKKDYTYTCNTQPLTASCNKPACRLCKHGIGTMDFGFPEMGSLTKLCTEPPLWFLEIVGGGRLSLTTEDLQSPTAFQLRCMQVLNVMPIIPKRENWQQIVQKLLENVSMIEVPKDATPRGQLATYLEEFCTGRAQGSTAEDLILGRPWSSNGRTYFRMRDFQKYLDRQRFECPLNSIISILQAELKMEHKFWQVRGKGVNTWHVEEFNRVKGPFDAPKIEEERPY